VLGEQGPPETEGQLGDDTSGQFGTSIRANPPAGLSDLVPGAARQQDERVDVPRQPCGARGLLDDPVLQPVVHGVASAYLEQVQGLEEGRTHAGVPQVQGQRRVDVAARRSLIAGQAWRRQS